MQYAQDYDEVLPNGGWSGTETLTWPNGTTSTMNTWFLRLYPYIKNVQILLCPSVGGGTNYATPPTDYNTNDFNLTPAGCRLGSIQQPAATLLLEERQRNYNNFSEHYSDWLWRMTNERATLTRHNEGLNVTLCDGHSKWIKPETVGLDAASGKGIWFLP
jgi:prepilin-type processing-associated H-X9-DG protein